MIKLHPNSQQLSEFAQGQCDSGVALIIAAHTDMCRQCKQKLTLIEAELAREAMAEKSSPDPAFDTMLANILQMPAASGIEVSYKQKKLELDGKEFVLPRSLQRYADKINGWSHLPGKLWQARVDLGIDGRADFTYMEKGGSVPEHTHRGTELTLVLDGEFSDGIRNYDTGDFIERSCDHVHTPHTEADEGCLVFSILDKPLHFTSGIARLLNPFSQLFFK
ncbi:ChrR family anti-sigma-E factor [Lacimicrobium alkaliphilum]|uniref:Transcriptional regulator n=1 Tax=Lacimicrobium alkaliphilum TaxID=1526571 RepID=A0ABQ1RDM1_9ALTE|nr:ChrR family anti-sigma-E factor [Lacimicrobium alkaliphilum]GGD66249.1 transcriptional regulator [Lacimicrobium alkaliphilum]